MLLVMENVMMIANAEERESAGAEVLKLMVSVSVQDTVDAHLLDNAHLRKSKTQTQPQTQTGNSAHIHSNVLA